MRAPRASKIYVSRLTSSSDSIIAMPRSRTVQRLVWPTLFCFGETALLAAYATLRHPGWPALPYIGPELFNLTGPALSLLLVFRTDASFMRWDEARRHWGELIYKSRNLMRQGTSAFPGAGNAELRCALAQWTVAFGVLLKLHLREDTGLATLRKELRGWLDEGQLSCLAGVQHQPSYALAVLTHLVRRAPRDDRPAMDDNLESFEQARAGSTHNNAWVCHALNPCHAGARPMRAAAKSAHPSVVHPPHEPLFDRVAADCALLSVDGARHRRAALRAALVLPSLRCRPDWRGFRAGACLRPKRDCSCMLSLRTLSLTGRTPHSRSVSCPSTCLRTASRPTRWSS